MSLYKVSVVFLFLVLLLFGAASAQYPHPCERPADLVSEPTQFGRWRLDVVKNVTDAEAYSSIGERLFIRLPARYSGERSIPCTRNGKLGNGSKYVWFATEGDFYVTHLTFLKPQVANDADRAILTEEIKKDILAGAGSKILSDSKIVTNGLSGVEIKFDTPDDLNGITRVYASGKEEYIVTVIFPKNLPEYEKIDLAVLDSFKTFSEQERTAYYEREVARTTPKPLPQSPVPPRAGSDARDEGLKGKVKHVSFEIEELTGYWAYPVKYRESENFYDIRGNRVKDNWYWHFKYPMSITVYGYIDGARVSLQNDVVRGSNGPEMSIQGPGYDKPQASQAPDPRYTSKYIYAYDNKNRLIEKSEFANDGKFESHKKYKYKDNSVEITSDNSSGEIMLVKTIRLDDKQNDAEIVTTYMAGQNGDSKDVYKYESFDKNGNWTKRIVTTYVKKGGDWQQFNSQVEYRTITYYP